MHLTRLLQRTSFRSISSPLLSSSAVQSVLRQQGRIAGGTIQLLGRPAPLQTPPPPHSYRQYTSSTSQAAGTTAPPLDTATTTTTTTTPNTSTNTSKFIHAVAFLPHPDKGEKGEDAYFITDNDQIAGVADGVGGWIEMGIDAGAFSRQLMGSANKFAVEENSLDPGAILSSAYFSTTEMGTCTACIIALDGKELRAINVGDSGFSILRRQIDASKSKADLNDDPPQWSLYFQTTEQTHFFNCPFQLGTNSRDSPSDGQQFNLPMHHGDLIILATDGLIDNIFTAELIQASGSFVLSFSAPVHQCCASPVHQSCPL